MAPKLHPNLFITVSLVDKYPKKNGGKGFGVFNVDVEPKFDPKLDSARQVKSQMWSYDYKSKGIMSLAHPGKAIFEGFN